MALDLSRFAKAFFEEAQEHVLSLEALLIRINVHAPDDESLNAIFRAVHSIKGGAAAFGHSALADFTHAFESLLDRVRKRTLPLSKSMVDQFLRAGDLMRTHLQALEAGQTPDALPMQIMQDILRGMGDQSASVTPTTERAPTAQAPQPQVVPHHHITLVLDRGAYSDPSALADLQSDLRGLGSVEGFATELVSETTMEVSFRLLDGEATADIDAAELRESLEFLVPAESMQIVRVAPTPGSATDGAAVGAASTANSAIADHSPALASSGESDDGFFDDDPDGAYEFFAPMDNEPAPVATAAALSESDIALANVADASTIRVSVSKVDQIINQVGELVIAEAMLTQAAQALPPEVQQRLASGLAQLQRNTRDLQESVLAIRMMPISFVFSRLPRLTRDLADRLGKEVEIDMGGEDTELDKSVIEKLSDPLTHLVRNAIDHGIELPDARVAAGKPAMGRLEVRAAHAGGSVVISVSDDGAGLNRARILDKARQLGLDGTDAWTDSEVWQLIFTPGFSTAAAVTDVSGRGVGMDVVWQNVHALGGKTEIASTPGRGTTITIRLPLTLAILDGLCISVAEETYILALANVMQSMQPREDEIRTVNGQRVVLVRDEYVPILSLAQLFGLSANSAEAEAAEGDKGNEGNKGILVILDVDGLHAALEVDDLLGQQQVVLKSLESNYKRVAGIAGATILGDGRVALILDAAYLVSLTHATQRGGHSSRGRMSVSAFAERV